MVQHRLPLQSQEALNVMDGSDQDAQEIINAPQYQNQLRLRMCQLRLEITYMFPLRPEISGAI